MQWSPVHCGINGNEQAIHLVRMDGCQPHSLLSISLRTMNATKDRTRAANLRDCCDEH